MMKKLLCTLLALALFTLSFVPALAEAPDLKVGGWSAYADDPTVIPQEALDAFSKAIDGLVGCTYEPIALLGTQVVSGMNYCLLCRLTAVYPDAEPGYALVYVYQSLDGSCQLLRVEDIVFSIQAPVAE